MSPLSVFYLHSQLQLCEQLMQQADKGDTFMFLSGETGSGRSTLLELTATGVERKMRSVYLPCTQETTLGSLTKILASQLLPPADLSQDLPLNAVLNKISADSKNKLFIVADDIDLAAAECFQALIAICKKFAGSHSCTLLCAGSPEWVQQQAETLRGQQIKHLSVSQYAVTPLNDDEGMKICQLVFKSNQAQPLFAQFQSRIQSGLASCGGNISRIIAYADQLSEELSSPDGSSQPAAAAPLGELSAGPQQTAEADPAAAEVKKEGEGAKKSGSVLPKICVLLLVLLAAGYAGKTYFDGRSEQNSTAATPQSVPAPAVSDPVVDEGALNEPVPEGIAVQTPPPSTQQSITLSGEELQQIEDGTLPPQAVQLPAADTAPALENSQPEEPAVQEPAGLPADDTLPPQEVQLPAPAAAPALENSLPDEPAAQEPAVLPAEPASDAVTATPPTAAAGALEDEKAVVLPVQSEPIRINEVNGRENTPAPAPAAVQEQMIPAPAPVVVPAAAEVTPAADPAPAAAAADEKVTIPARPEPAAAAAPAPAAQKPAPAADSAASGRKRTAQPARSGVLRPENVTFSGKAVPGGTAELAAKNDRSYTIQIVASRNKEALSKVAAALTDRYWIYETSRERRPWYVLITGDYPNSAAAQQAISRLPGVLKTAKPFVKSFGTVKQEIARAQ